MPCGDDPPRKTRRCETPSGSKKIKVLFVDKTLPTLNANGRAISEIVYGDADAILKDTVALQCLATFRGFVLRHCTKPVLLDDAVLRDCEAVEWEIWDAAFATFVALTSKEQLVESHDFRQHSIARIHLVSKRHRLHEPQRCGLPHEVSETPASLLTAREGTFLGSAALIRLPTHHSLSQQLHTDTTTAATQPSLRVRIFLIRHGESVANVDPTVYRHTPDHAIPLTEAGLGMATTAGAFLRKLFEEQHASKAALGHHVRMLVSPYERTRQTAQQVLKALNHHPSPDAQKWIDSVKELPYLAEQDFGLCEGEGQVARAKCGEELERITLQRDHRGKFWSRFPHGESPFDVAVRMAGVATEIVTGCSTSTASRQRIQTFVVVSHGITIRSFLAAWCSKSPEWVADSVNPPNCSIQLVEEMSYRGYVYGGVERGREVDASEMGVMDDPRQNAWDEFL